MTDFKMADWLKEKIMRGEAILFLGAGASRDALTSKGVKVYVSANDIKKALSDKYLGGKKKKEPLALVAEYAKDESSLRDVQEVIKELFSDVGPANFHQKIAKFKWKAIVTTNYDLIVEKAYQAEKDSLQKLVSVLGDEEHLEEILKDPDNVPYLKLHGCITRINSTQFPLILASEQYAKYRKNRDNIFNVFSEWGREYPIIFCGYNLADPNIQYILFDLGDSAVSRPRYTNVNPSLDELDAKYWQGRRFDVVPFSFEEFINYLDSEIPFYKRQLSFVKKAEDLSYGRWIGSSSSPSSDLTRYLDENFWHVYPGMPIEGASPKDFYKGLGGNWGAIEQDLDVRRRIEDDILLNAVIDDSNIKKVQSYILKGYAGSGKSISLKRVAWDAAHDFEKLVFHLKDDAFVRPEILLELYNLVKQRIFIVIGDIVPVIDEVLSLIDYSIKEQIEITIIFGARTNEWNIIGEELATKTEKEFELRNLSNAEINELIGKLEKNHSLGHLQKVSKEERVEAFKLNAGKQLLVALHEATSGKPFEEIIYNEFINITPDVARILYLDICTLNRLGVPVRAGLISRISEINFNIFKDKLLAPLEHVVIAKMDTRIRDYIYKTRHPLIAKMVFKEVLKDPEERANQLVRMIRYLNLSYQADETAFFHLIKGKTIADMFADRRLGDQIFRVALGIGTMESYIEHQKAIFELNHSAGSLTKAVEAIKKSETACNYRSNSISHTYAIILRRKANESRSKLEKDKYRTEAKEILQKQLPVSKDAHAHHAFGQILLDELKDKFDDLKKVTDSEEERIQQRAIIKIIENIEEVISKGIQRFQGDEYLYTLRSELAKLVNDQPKATSALLAAFNSNPRSGFAAIRLAYYYLDKNNSDEAIKILEKCLKENPHNKSVNLHLAKIYIKKDEKSNSHKIIHHLKNSFTEGDANYDAQFWTARHHFLFGNKEYSDKLFGFLNKVRVPPSLRNRQRGYVKDLSGKLVKYEGIVVSKQDSYCHVNSPDLGQQNVFIYYDQFSPDDWDIIHIKSMVRFNFGFSIRGPQGVNALLIHND